MSSPTTSYWCYRCTRIVRLTKAQDHIVRPYCQSGFVEEIHTNPSSNRHLGPSASAAMSIFAHEPQNSFNLRRQGFRRRHRHAVSRSPLNLVIVFRGPAYGDVGGDGGDHGRSSNFELYYDNGDGSGLRPLPPDMLELIGSGFNQLLEQILQIENNGLRRLKNLPTSKTAIGSMPTIEIVEDHVISDTCCAICKEAFEIGSEAREMPCKHIYHSDCIVTWLSMRNSCPLCRNGLPSERNYSEIDEETIGLTIWRLPGGDFAVGRFLDGRSDGESHLPIVYTEMDGGLNANGVPRRISRGEALVLAKVMDWAEYFIISWHSSGCLDPGQLHPPLHFPVLRLGS